MPIRLSVISLTSSPTPPLPHSASAPLASLPMKVPGLSPSLNLLFPPPEMLFPQTATWVAHSPSSGLDSTTFLKSCYWRQVHEVWEQRKVYCRAMGRCPGEGNGYPLQYSDLENSMDRGTWQATVHGAAKSWTWLSNFQARRTYGSCSKKPKLPEGFQQGESRVSQGTRSTCAWFSDWLMVTNP